MKIRFQLAVETTLGITTNLCFASNSSPNACWPAPGIPGLSQLGFGTVEGSTTKTPSGSMVAAVIT